MSNVFDHISSEDPDNDPLGSDSLPVEESATRTRTAIRKVCQELLRHGYIEEQNKPEVFRGAITFSAEISSALEPFDLELRTDEHRGVAFLVVAKDDGENGDGDGEWSHPLVRRQRLTLEQSLLIAILRQAFIHHEQEAGVGGSPAKVAVEDLMPQFLTYLEDSGSDAKNESRLSSLLDQLKSHGIVSEIDKNNEVTIRPLIAHLANPDSLGALLRKFEEEAGS